MALSSQQITYLKNADQRFAAHIALFPAYSPVITAPNPGNGTLIALKPMPLVSPRYSVVANNEAITLYATDSYNRGGVYVGNANIAWANTGGAGTLVDNADGTATYTAPGVGAGTNLITMTATNANGSKAAKVYVAYPKTTYDALVAEIATISGSVSQHGWQVLLKVSGDTSDFAIGKIILLHIEDTWTTTTSTFGGYKYAEGTFVGYITQMQYYEDAGVRWLGVEAQSSWAKLDKIQLSETFWGLTKRIGRFYLSDFRPIDALWYLLTETTDFYSRHNCTLFYDTNMIDDLIIGGGGDSRVSFATIIEDVMARGLAIAYTDRYSSLMCIPDPDVRSDEWWGTPTPLYDGSEPLTEQLCMSYSVTQLDVPAVRRMVLLAFDSYRLGMWGVSQASAGTQGEEKKIAGLLCDDTLKLVTWASEKRAQFNKPWDITVDLPLNHTVDLCTPIIAIFTAPSQSGGATASGLCWIEAVNYRPTWNGGWNGQWHLVKNSQSDTGQNGEVSGWGGSGQWATGGSGAGIAPSGWQTPPQASATWLHTFNFKSNNGGWVTANFLTWPVETGPQYEPDPVCEWVTAQGWSAHFVTAISDGILTTIYLKREFGQRIITGNIIYYSAPEASTITFGITDSQSANLAYSLLVPSGTGNIPWSGTSTANKLWLQSKVYGNTAYPGQLLWSATLAGFGVNPFT